MGWVGGVWLIRVFFNLTKPLRQSKPRLWQTSAQRSERIYSVCVASVLRKSNF